MGGGQQAICNVAHRQSRLAGGLGPLAPRTVSCMFTPPRLHQPDFHQPRGEDHNTTWTASPCPWSGGRGACDACKQTGSCLHRASAALSIFNSVRNGSRGWWRGEEMYGSGHVTSDQRSSFARRADLSADLPAEGESG